MTAAYLAKFTKAHGFQRIQKEIVHCSNTLLSGSTMGARVRRKEMIAMIKEVHSIVKAMQESHGDKVALEATKELQSTSEGESKPVTPKVASKVTKVTEKELTK